MDRGSGKLVNIGTGLETSVNHLYRLLADIIGYTGEPGSRPAAAGGAAADRARHRAGADRDRRGSPGRTSRTGSAETVAFLKGV